MFAPRHAANLLRLKAFFSRQWRQMPAAQFMAVFGPYSQRIGLADREQAITELTDLKTKALSQLAAQHDEITRLRRHAEQSSGRVRHLPTACR